MNSIVQILVFVAAVLISSNEADYPCFCNYSWGANVYSIPDLSSSVLGFILEFDCKALAVTHGAYKGFLPIQFRGQLGYISTTTTTGVNRTCSGSPPLTDIIKTTTTHQTTTTITAPTVTWPGLTLISTEYTSPPNLYWSMAANVSGTSLQYLGIGYNLLTGNPLVASDPGMLLNKRILQLTGSSSDVKEASVLLTPSCPYVVTKTLVHGSQSLQKEMMTLVQPSSTHPYSLTVHAFVYNFDFKSQRRHLENNKTVYQDSLTTCNNGSAHYRGNSTTPFGNFSVSHEFAKAVCKLSSANTSAINEFLDEWGTSVVLSVDLGTKTLYRTTEPIQQLFQTIQETDPALLVQSGPFNGYQSSMSINEQMYSTSSVAQQSSTQNIVMTAGGTFPVPVGLTIVPISDIIRAEYFASVFDILVADSSCPHSFLSGELDTISANVKAVLANYNVYKQYGTNINQVLTDQSLQIPVTWPRGTYGVMKTASGCPGSQVTWFEGSRFQDTEDMISKNSYTSDITRFLAGSFASNNIQTEFCIKSQPQVSQYDGDWPRGAYCLLKKGNCPTGFQSGSIYWDDESLFNKSKASGTLPDGEFGSNTRINYCCRNDGPTTSQIILPTDRPFVLLRYGLTCQNVHSMLLKELYVYWDDDLSNSDSASGMHPYDDGGSDDHRLHFCFYQKNSPGTSIVG